MENNNDKAKRILLGRTDIDENCCNEYAEGRQLCSVQCNECKPQPQSQWNDPEMTGDIMGVKIIEDKLGVVGENEFKALTPEQAEAYKRMVEIKNGLTPPIDASMDIQNEKKWYDKEGDILDALQRVCDYCNEIGISPDQLINDHRETVNTNYSDFQ